MQSALVTLVALTLMALPAGAELVIFDVRKNLKMSDTDLVYHDYYISGGSDRGLTEGQVLTVARKLPLYDSYQNHAVGDLQLKVAKVKLIHVQKSLSVARLQSEFERENAPVLEDNFIMVGDVLDLTGAGSSSTAATGEAKAAESAAAAPAAPKNPPVTTPPSAKTERPVAQISVNSVSVSPKSAAAPVDAPKME